MLNSIKNLTALNLAMPTGVNFLPSQLPNLSFWLRADFGLFTDSAGTTPAVTTDPIGNWKDQSGNSNNFLMATASRRPTYTAAQLNGNGILTLDGTDDNLWTPNNIATFSTKRGTLFVVAKATGAKNADALVSLYQDSGNAGPWELILTSFATQVQWYDGVTSQNGSAVTANQWYYHTVLRDADTTVKLYKNGSLTTTLTVANNQPTAGEIKVGSSSQYLGAASEQLNGNVAEVIYYDRALSATELSNVHSYLSKKFAL